MNCKTICEQKIGWWRVIFDLKLEGEDVYFDDISECSQDHIVNCIKDGCFQGQLIEEAEYEEGEDEGT